MSPIGRGRTIPAVRVAERINRNEHLLLWVLKGTASTRCGTVEHRLHGGQVLWVPAAVPHELDLEPGALVFPIAIPVPNLAGPPAEPSVYTIGSQWDNWMLHHYAAYVTPLRHTGYRQVDIVARLQQASAPATDLPIFPRSAAAYEVAIALHRNPALGLTAEQWASRARVSVRTLRRAFIHETGLTLSAWRQLCRLQAATEYLCAGYNVAWVAGQVGFDSAAGFIRAFARHYGQTPAAWVRSTSVGAIAPQVSERVRLSRDNAALASRLNSEPATLAEQAPPIPPTVASTRTYPDHHVILWMYKGTAQVQVGEGAYKLSRGDAIWMPAAHPHAVHVDADSIALPMTFYANEIDVSIDDVAVIPVPPGLNDVVLHNVVANLTAIRPDGYRRLAILDLFAEHAARHREQTVPMPTDPAAKIVAQRLNRYPHDPRTLTHWADELGVEADILNRSFRNETGKSFTAWRATARMHAARDLLKNGTPPVAAARRLGYAHLSGFSRDFTRHHGLSPRAYQQQQSSAR